MAPSLILAERLKLFATRTSKLAILLAAFLTLPAGLASGANDRTPSFTSSMEALKQGVSAFNGGYYDIAIPALQYAGKEYRFYADFYLASIFSDSSGQWTDHARASRMFQEIADEYAEVDPDDDPRAKYLGKALTALAGYLRTGLKEIGLEPDPQRAAEYLHNASVSFNDEDAQFEIAKMQLKGDGVEQDIMRARHWLARLSQKGHAGAQAFLADLLWRGRYMPKDESLALALITVGVDNAPPTERLWIEDVYQNIFCSAGQVVRLRAGIILAEWDNRYGRKPTHTDRSGLGTLVARPSRVCGNTGELITRIQPQEPEIAGSETAKPDREFARGGAASGPSLSVGGSRAPSPGLQREVGAGFAPGR